MYNAMHQKFKQWLAIAVSEIILSLVLISLAPTFLNSKKPFWGFVIWLSVPTILASSSVYGLNKLVAARQARKMFIKAFPEYAYLGVAEFIELSPARVASAIALLQEIKETSEIQEYNISLFEVLEQMKHD